jgi:hypothetical protein
MATFYGSLKDSVQGYCTMTSFEAKINFTVKFIMLRFTDSFETRGL